MSRHKMTLSPKRSTGGDEGVHVSCDCGMRHTCYRGSATASADAAVRLADRHHHAKAEGNRS